MTARACFAAEGQSVSLGRPAQPSTATVGLTDPARPGGQSSPIVWLVPHPDRNVVLAKLASPPTGITPVPIGTTAPAVGDALRVAGYGRTSTEWVPDRPHTAAFEVTAVDAGTMGITGQAPDQPSPCKGDAGGPALREIDGRTELVAINHTSWQYGCLGETETRQGAVEARVDDLTGWVRQSVAADVSVFGATAEGRLTYTAIDSASGDRVGEKVTSAASLGFVPRALATLNANTLLVTSVAGRLHRVDVTGTNPLTFSPPVGLLDNWTYDLLSYDGGGSLYGIMAGTLHRHTVTTAKPAGAHIINDTVIGTGFTLNAMTTTGPDWLLGTTTAGALISYRIRGIGSWDRYALASTGWNVTHLLSPGNGLYYARSAAGALQRYRDPAPFDGSAADLQSFPQDPVDSSGWDQALLSAQPIASFPESLGDVSVFGVTTDGRLTYSSIDSASGDRVGPTATSTSALPFAARALATLNFNTLLVVSTGSVLYRVDLVSTSPLVFAAPVEIGGGWTFDLLSYDGEGSLYGIKDDGTTLRRYTVAGTKPVAGDITDFTTIGTGFTLNAMTTTGPDWLLGTTTAGALISYRIKGIGSWDRYALASTGWNVTHLLSPGNGLYYARSAAGALQRYRDPAPFDGSAADLQSFPQDPVDATGWDQALLSAQPIVW